MKKQLNLNPSGSKKSVLMPQNIHTPKSKDMKPNGSKKSVLMPQNIHSPKAQ
jgi:hypothetical protein